MNSTMEILAPTRARGPVGLAVRTADCAVRWPAVERLHAVPAATPRRGTSVHSAFGIAVFATPAIDALGTAGYVGQVSKRTTTENNGTTLGIHSSGSPSS